MAKFCGQCGAPLDGDEKICGQCGNPVDSAAAKQVASSERTAKAKVKVKKVIKIVLPIVLVLALGGIAFRVVTGFTGANGLVRTVMSAYKEDDASKLVSNSSDLYYYSQYNNDAAETYFQDMLACVVDSFEYGVGYGYKFSYDVNDIHTLSERRKNDLYSQFEDEYPAFDMSTISQIKVANVTVTASKNKESESMDMNLYLSKEGKDWKILMIEFDYYC